MREPWNIPEIVTAGFRRIFGAEPMGLARAPGRVNLIGEHTDYNAGFVMPLAVDRAAWIAFRPRPDDLVSLHSADFGNVCQFRLGKIERGGPEWGEYVKGVAWAMRGGYDLRGWEGVIGGDIPVGAGLSSSAGLQLAVARTFLSDAGSLWNPVEAARLCQQAEIEWVGVNVGIMDQMISAGGRAGHALLIDCRSLETRQVPLPPGTAVVVLDTGTRRGLVDSKYNERRAQCEAAARHFGAAALRDVTLDDLDGSRLEPLILRRARHVVSENVRVLEAQAAMEAGDAAQVGRLMQASHASLRDDYEVSIPALDAMVGEAMKQDGCHGARMTGAGFGGCAVALVDAAPEVIARFVPAVEAGYRAATGNKPSVYVCQAADGAELMRIQEFMGTRRNSGNSWELNRTHR